MFRGPRRVILHVGLPKTGTTALQIWCSENREQLGALGMHYPEALGAIKTAKHDQIVRCLLTGHLDPIRDMVAEYSESNLLLSMEGLTNHLYDFSPSALEEFRQIFLGFEIHAFMVIRERSAWIRSYYKQCVVNPPNERYHYATPLDLQSFAELPRVKRLANFMSLKDDVRAAYGATRVVVAQYEGGFMKELFRLIGIEQNDPSMREQNTSLPEWMIDFVRQINEIGLEPGVRTCWLGALQSCFKTKHDIMQGYAEIKIPNYHARLNLEIFDKIKLNTEEMSFQMRVFKSFLEKTLSK